MNGVLPGPVQLLISDLKRNMLIPKLSRNEQAKKDHPEAPGPVIGMNDERGGVSLHSDGIASSLLDWFHE